MLFQMRRNKVKGGVSTHAESMSGLQGEIVYLKIPKEKDNIRTRIADQSGKDV
jgi:hypothetical protein